MKESFNYWSKREKTTNSLLPGSTITGSTSGENDQNLGNFINRKLSSADSYGSLASSYLPQTRTSSLLKSHQDELFSNRKSFAGSRTSRYVFVCIKVHSIIEFQVKNLDINRTLLTKMDLSLFFFYYATKQFATKNVNTNWFVPFASYPWTWLF